MISCPLFTNCRGDDKFRAIQFLTAELAQSEGLTPGAEYPVWSPYEAHDAAVTLAQYLGEETKTS
jgi:hypothetical protein